MKKRFLILVAIMAVTKGISAQNSDIPYVFSVKRQSVLSQAINEPKTDSTRFFAVINRLPLTEPLILVDGQETSNGLSSLRPDDIKSITILKDATATSIFGTRGANGVILIVTKSGNKEMIEPETNTTIIETENQIEPETDATVVETENQFVPDLDATQLEYDYVSEIETETVETETENPFPNLKIYPNPFSGTLNLTGAEGCTLIVIAEDGVIVHTQKIINPLETIVLEHLRTGVYFFFLNDGKHTKTVRGVKN